MPDSEIRVSGLRSLGLALLMIGDSGKSQQVLEQSLAIASLICNNSANVTSFAKKGFSQNLVIDLV
jgi:hypothetical protein